VKKQARTTQDRESLIVRLVVAAVRVRRHHKAQALENINHRIPLFGQHVGLPVRKLAKVGVEHCTARQTAKRRVPQTFEQKQVPAVLQSNDAVEVGGNMDVGSNGDFVGNDVVELGREGLRSVCEATEGFFTI